MARGTPISRAGALTSSSRPPSLRKLSIVDFGTSGESFNWNASLALSEEPTVPSGRRWWKERVFDWAASIEGVTLSTRQTYREHVGAIPDHLVRLGFAYPASGDRLTREMVETYAHDPTLAPTTRSMNLALLRSFVRWTGSPLADSKRLWKGPKPVATRRFWLTKDQLAALLEAATGRERVVIALAGFNGLRSAEIRELRVENCRMDLPDPRLVFRGKGDKIRDIAMNRAFAWPELLPLVTGKNAKDRVYPFGRTTIDRDVKAACRCAGLPPRSPHDLRRSFGRIAYHAGVSLNVIQAIYGHADLAETSYYVGVDQTEQRAGIDLFARAFEVPGPETCVSGPAAHHFTDVPARSW